MGGRRREPRDVFVHQQQQRSATPENKSESSGDSPPRRRTSFLDLPALENLLRQHTSKTSRRAKTKASEPLAKAPAGGKNREDVAVSGHALALAKAVLRCGALGSRLSRSGQDVPEEEMHAAWQWFLGLSGREDDGGSFMPGSFPRKPELLDALSQDFCFFTSTVVRAQTSGDGSTTKLLVRLADGHTVETVIIRHGATTAENPSGDSRTTLCVSSQIGCKMACSFCATGTMGEIGNLSTGEILEQMVHARRFAGDDVRNVVFMGMGEPMNNYEAVRAAVRALVDPRVFNLSPNHVTVSTVGIIPQMLRFIDDLPTVNLALSLHAPTQDLRSEFVPAAKAFPMPRLMETVDAYLQRTSRRILVEYVLIAGVNASKKEALELGALLRGRRVTLNLIPYNDTHAPEGYKAPNPKQVSEFRRILSEEFDIRTTVRQEMGQDIAGACGQLVVKEQRQDREFGKNESASRDVPDIEDADGRSGVNVRARDQRYVGVRTALWSVVETGKKAGKKGSRRAKAAAAAQQQQSLGASDAEEEPPSGIPYIFAVLAYLFLALAAQDFAAGLTSPS